MKLKINLEQEMTDEELDVLYEEFDIDGENKAAQLCFFVEVGIDGAIKQG